MSSSAEDPAPLLVVPVFGNLALASRTLRALDEATDPAVPLMVIDDRGFETLSNEALSELVRSGRELTFVQHDANRGFVASVNEGFEARCGRDVVILNSDVTVYPGWLEGLTDAARGERVASVTAATNSGSIATDVEAQESNGPEALAPLAAHRRRQASAARPIPVAVGHCLYLTDEALRAVGQFDNAFAPGYGEEVDWSIRAARLGWRHLLAPSVLVWHQSGGSFGRRTWLRRRHEARLAWRYPKEFLTLRLRRAR